MWLTGEDKRLLHEALVSAFYNVQLLREMVTYRCDQQLDHFTDGTRSSRATRSRSPRAPTAAIPVEILALPRAMCGARWRRLARRGRQDDGIGS